MAGLGDLPIELYEQIILFLDPIDAVQFAQTCSVYYSLLYAPDDQRLWRELYLREPFDDPRQCRTSLGCHPPPVDWKTQLQRIIRARTVLTNPSVCKPEERCVILQTLIDLVSTCIPSPEPSNNQVWVAAMLRASPLLSDDPSVSAWESDAPSADPDREEQLRARLHTYYGLTSEDYQSSALTRSRAFVYAMRNYKFDNDFGPYLMDSSGRVNWVHVRALHHVVSMHIVPRTEEATQAAFNVFPMSMPWTQSVIPHGLDLKDNPDWAGVNGRWQCSFCFCDHRELLSKCLSTLVQYPPHKLLVYNDFNTSDTAPLNPAMFDEPDFVEVYRCFFVELRVLGFEEDPEHPGFPRIRFGGSIEGHAIMVGDLRLTPDDQIRWHFVSKPNNMFVHALIFLADLWGAGERYLEVREAFTIRAIRQLRPLSFIARKVFKLAT